MKYNLNDRPPAAEMLLYGLQWFIVSLPCLIIMGGIMTKIHYHDAAEQTLYIQKLFALMGVTTIVQVLFGHRLPLVIGPASVLMIGIMASLPAGIPAIYTAIAVGGALVAILAFSGLLAKIVSIFTARVVIVILLLIPFTLMPVILDLTLNNSNGPLFNMSFTLLMLLGLLLCNKFLRGVWKSTTVVWGLVAGTVICFAFFGLPEAGQRIDSHNDATSLLLSRLEFGPGTVIAFLFCFIALIVNELGSIEAVGQMLRAGGKARRIKYGVGISGLSNIMAGAMGVIGSVDFSMGVGVISTTKCASRYTLIPAGIALTACAFMAPVINYLNHIPEIVMGVLLLYLMAAQLSSGLVMTGKERAIRSVNDGIVVGLPIMTAVFVAFAPADSLAQIPSLAKPIAGNGFVMGVVAVLILEHIVFRKARKKR